MARAPLASISWHVALASSSLGVVHRHRAGAGVRQRQRDGSPDAAAATSDESLDPAQLYAWSLYSLPHPAALHAGSSPAPVGGASPELWLAATTGTRPGPSASGYLRPSSSCC
jgi:hypothetical protein